MSLYVWWKEVIIYSEKNDNRIFIFEVNYFQCTNEKSCIYLINNTVKPYCKLLQLFSILQTAFYFNICSNVMYSYDAKSEFSAAIAPIFSVTWLEIIVIFLNRAVADVVFRDQCLFIGSIWLQSIKIGSILFVSGLFDHKYLQIFFPVIVFCQIMSHVKRFSLCFFTLHSQKCL